MGKECTRCRVHKAMTEYTKEKGAKDGLRSQCKDCRAAIAKERTDKARQLLSDLKMETGCVDCGYREHPAALDFDHLPEYSKAFTIGNCVGYSIDRIIEEVAKCEVVCANCHRIRTVERVQHG